MFTRIRVSPRAIEVADRAALILWSLAGFFVAVLAAAALALWREALAEGADLGTAAITVAFGLALGLFWLSRRLWLVRCRFDADERRVLFERRNLRERQHRFVPFDDVAEVELRERRDDDGDWVRGLHVVLRDGERVEVIGTDQTDRGEYAPLADAIRAMVMRPGRPTPPPSPPRA